METQIISKSNLKKIHDVACSAWKTKLESYANRNPFDSEIELTQSEINEMFDASDDKQKKVLNKFFTQPKSIMDRVKSFEDACEVLCINPKDITNLKVPSHIKAQMKLEIIAEALNDGWSPDWTNHNECKYYPWFEVTEEGVYRYYCYGYFFGFIGFSSTLYYKTSDLATYAGNTFIDLYKELTINNNKYNK